MTACRWSIICLFLAGCQTVPVPRTSGLIEFTHQFDTLTSADAHSERELARQQYAVQPDDETRWRLAYALSHPDASLRQLSRSREILAEIPDQSEIAPLRDLLNREVRLLMELQKVQGHALELQAQLDALKKIEAEMVERRQQMDDVDQ